MLTVYDHTEPNWSARYGRTGRENGAATYSRDIVRHQIPLWEAFTEKAGRNVTVSTCPLLDEFSAPGAGGDLAVQYLHTYRYRDPLRDAVAVAEWSRSRFQDVWFVTAYRPLRDLLLGYGLTAIHLPMTIDVEDIRAKAGPPRETYPDRFAWYGNLTRDKHSVYGSLRKRLGAQGMHLDIISGPQTETLPRLRQYAYGVGVGRSALEMMALGLNVMIGGAKFGGLITNELEFRVQQSVNFNGRVVTYDRDPETCLQKVMHPDSGWASEQLFDSSAATNILCDTLGISPREIGASS